jgi:hypothetical protein
VAYGNFAELKVRRWEAAGVAARTGLDIALTHGNGDAAGTNIMSLTSNGNVGIGTLTPSASLHLRAGTTTAGSAPLKFTSGSVMTTPEAGAMEYNGSNLYFTTGSVRENIILTSNLATKVSKTGDTMTGNLVVSGAKIGINNGATAIAATDLHIGSGSIAIDGAVSTRLEPIISSPGNYARTLTFHPTYTGNTGVNAIALQTLPEVGSGASMPLLYGMLSAFIGNVTTWVGIAVVDGGGTATTKYDAIFNGGGRVGIATSTPTARLQIGAGSATANTAPLKFTSGTNLTSVESGSMEYDGTHLYFSPVATRKIVTYRKNVTAVSSSLTASVDSCLIASGSFTITLPNPSTVGNGAEITIKKTSTGASTITISASAGFVEGATTTTLTTQYSTYRFISDGSTNWWSI